MFYSSVFVFSLVVMVNLSGAQSPGRYPPNYNMPPKNTVVNIGNGFNKRNIVTLDQGSNNGQLGYRFNEPTPNVNYQNSGPPHWPQMQGSTTNNIGNGIGNKNTVVVSGDRGNGGQSYGTDKFNVGYGPDNNNKIIVNGRPIIPKAPVYGSRPSQTNGNAANARNSGGSTPNAQTNHIIVNGKSVKPNSSDSRYDTYYLDGQTIHIQKSEPQPQSNNAVQNLRSINNNLEQIKAKLQQEAAKLHVRL